jgi:GTP-binding protein
VAEQGLEKIPMRQRNKIEIINLHGGGYQVMHKQLEKAVERYDLSQDENVGRFILLLRKYKVEQLLEVAGAKAGDSVTIGYKEFEFYPDYFPPELSKEEASEIQDN